MSGKMLGKELRFKANITEEYIVDLSDLDPGIYLIQVNQGSFQTIKKIIH
jgi:hypothetical protein